MKGFVLVIKPSLSEDPWATYFDLCLTYFYHALSKQIQFVVILKVTAWEEGVEFWEKTCINLERGEGTAKKSLSLTQKFSACISLQFYFCPYIWQAMLLPLTQNLSVCILLQFYFCLYIWQAMLPDPWSYKSPIVPTRLFSRCVSLWRGKMNAHIG